MGELPEGPAVGQRDQPGGDLHPSLRMADWFRAGVIRRTSFVLRPVSFAGMPVPRPAFGLAGASRRRFRTCSGPGSRGSGSRGRVPVPWTSAVFPEQRAELVPCALGFGFSAGNNPEVSAAWLRPPQPSFEVCGRWVSVAASGLGASGSWHGACGCSLGA